MHFVGYQLTSADVAEIRLYLKGIESKCFPPSGVSTTSSFATTTGVLASISTATNSTATRGNSKTATVNYVILFIH